MEPWPAPAPYSVYALTSLLRSVRVRLGWHFLVFALAAAGAVHLERGAGPLAPVHPSATVHAPVERASGTISRVAPDYARAFLAADAGSLRAALRRGDPPSRTGFREPGPAGLLPLAARPLQASAASRPLLPTLPGRPAPRVLAAARDGTLSSASNGVPPPPVA